MIMFHLNLQACIHKLFVRQGYTPKIVYWRAIVPNINPWKKVFPSHPKVNPKVWFIVLCRKMCPMIFIQIHSHTLTYSMSLYTDLKRGYHYWYDRYLCAPMYPTLTFINVPLQTHKVSVRKSPQLFVIAIRKYTLTTENIFRISHLTSRNITWKVDGTTSHVLILIGGFQPIWKISGSSNYDHFPYLG